MFVIVKPFYPSLMSATNPYLIEHLKDAPFTQKHWISLEMERLERVKHSSLGPTFIKLQMYKGS